MTGEPTGMNARFSAANTISFLKQPVFQPINSYRMHLSIDKLEPGMEVAADVVNLNGVLMIGQGAVLTERHLRILKAWGIDSIPIAGQELTAQELPPSQPQFTPAILRRAETQVNHRFRHVALDSNAVKIIHELAVRRAAQHFAQTDCTSALSGETP